MDLDGISQADLEGMDMDALLRLAQENGVEAPAIETPAQEAAENPMAQTPAEEVQEEAVHAAPPAAQPDAGPEMQDPARTRPDRDVPISHLREQLRQEQAEKEALLEALRDPERVRAHLAAIAPEPADWDMDPQGAASQMLAPILQQVQALQQQLAERDAQAAHQQMLMELAGKYGQNFHPTLQAFDREQPHLANLHPEVRYGLAEWQRLSKAAAPDPKAEEARINALAEAKAAEILAKQMGSGAPLRGIPTLGSAPQAREERPAPDIDKLSQREIDGMDLDVLLKLARGG